MRVQTFSVHEHVGGYCLIHNGSGETAWLGDGVDVFDDVKPGSAEFRDAWEEALNANVQETLAAYFPHHTHQE
jgi:hypothetical protein